MELEQRVKTLEYEMKILKNEIQRTLLDIHEQVLIHYYPSLRIEETQAPASVAQAVQSARASRTNSPDVPPATPVPTAAPAPAPMPAPAQTTSPITPAKPDTSAENVTPPIRKVSLDQVRATRSESAAAPAPGKSQDMLVNLVEWSVQNAAKFGKSRVTQLLKVCGEEGLFDSTIQTVLMQVVAMNKSTAPAQIVVNDVLDELLKLDRLLGRPANAEEALSLIEEAGLG